jgi:hypothetical protein
VFILSTPLIILTEICSFSLTLNLFCKKKTTTKKIEQISYVTIFFFASHFKNEYVFMSTSTWIFVAINIRLKLSNMACESLTGTGRVLL